MKKTISLMLVVLLLVAVMAPTAYATGRGETVTVTVTVNGDAFAGLSGVMSYNADALTYVSCGSSTGTAMFNPAGGYFSWYASENVSGSVSTISVTFTVNADAPCGSAGVSVSGVLVGNQNGEAVNAGVSVSSVSVDHIPGEAFEENHIAGDCVTDRCVDTVVKCSKCGVEISRTHNTTAAPGHKYEITDHKDATCTEEGYTVYTCACGDTYTETIKATGHNHVLTNSTTGANCKTPGKDTYTCSCGDSYTVDNQKYGPHSYVEGEYEKNDTHHWTKCELCGHETEKHPHEFVDKGGDKLECVCGATKDKATTPTSKPTDPTDPEGGNKTGDITPYPVFFVMIAALIGTAYGFKNKFVK